MRHGNIHLNTDLKKIIHKQRAANSEYRRQLRRIRAACPHTNSFASEWYTTEWFGARPAIRICANCGHEEHDRYWSNYDGPKHWGDDIEWVNGKQFDRYTIKTKFPKNSFIQLVNDILKYRIPGV